MAKKPIAASSACFDADQQNSLSTFVADAKTATICMTKTNPGDAQCLALDFASGEFKKTDKPAPPAVAKASIKESGGHYELCKADGACVKLDVPKAKAGPNGGDPEKWIVGAKEDGSAAVAAGGGTSSVLIFDAKGKRTKTIKYKEGDYSCLDGAQFLGETIYVTGNVCAGPGGGGFLFDATGKKLGKVENVNVYGATPQHIDGTVYAFGDFGNAKVVLVDVKTAKEVKAIEAPRPENCDNCDPLGDASTFTTSAVVKRPDGKLVAIGGHVAVLDPATGKVDKTYRFSVCKPK